MTKALTVLGTVTFAALLIFYGVLAGTLMGALSGWVVGLFFSETILTFFSYIFGSSHSFQMWQIGASLGFIGGFLRSVSTK